MSLSEVMLLLQQPNEDEKTLGYEFLPTAKGLLKISIVI